MNCIFCHKDSTTSRSVEHIIPESLGNKKHILPQGFVCDSCNHYFAVKIEKDLLEQPYFLSLRSRNNIRTKKNKLVKRKMIFPEICDSSEISTEELNNGNILYIDNENVYNDIINKRTHSMLELVYTEPQFPNTIMARFLAKCAMEYIIYIIKGEQRMAFITEVMYKQLKPIRMFARYGIGNWSYSQRRVYNEGAIFTDEKCKFSYENLHEMFLFFRNYKKIGKNMIYSEIYFATIIMGIEYVICITDPDISGYTQHWLKENNKKFPLERSNEHIINGAWLV